MLTEKQKEGLKHLSSDSTYIMLYGGSRSGKTYLICRCIVMRALKAPGSKHCVLRFRFSHVIRSVLMETFPEVMKTEFPGIRYKINKSLWYVEFANGSQFWFGGLDDKQRTEKILGNEYSSVYLNECSQISWDAVETVRTRLAEASEQCLDNRLPKELKLRMFFDCNPPNKAHWSYKVFVEKISPSDKKPLNNPEKYDLFQMNPIDNIQNLGQNYIDILNDGSKAKRIRFLDGNFAEANPSALFDEITIEKWRVTDGVLPDMLRVCVAVDPSGSGDDENAENDAIGIVVAGLGVDGNCYLLEDLTVKGGPATWGKVVADAFGRNDADFVVAETNYGGAMVKFVIQTANPRIPYKEAHAARGKVVRAEPIAALYEQGKVRHVGFYKELEDELVAFSTNGYTGPRSPNRADALVWAVTALFPGIVYESPAPAVKAPSVIAQGSLGWMG